MSFREKIPPDTTACIFWLKNRQPGRWRDVHRLEHSGVDAGPIEFATAAHIRAELERRGREQAIDVHAFTDVEVFHDGERQAVAGP